MVQTADGGGAVQAARDLEITIEAIQDIATRTMSELEERAQAERRDLREAVISPGSFGSAPPGQAVAASAQAAHEVFTATVAGIVDVLRQYQQNLLAVVRTYTAVDEANAAGLASLTPQELLDRFVERNEQTIARDEQGGHQDIEDREQEAYEENQDVLAPGDETSGGVKETDGSQAPAPTATPVAPQGAAPATERETEDF